MVAKARFVVLKSSSCRLLVRPAGWSKGYPFNNGFGPWDGGKGMMMGAYGGMMMPPMPLACLLGRFFSKCNQCNRNLSELLIVERPNLNTIKSY